MVYKKFKAWGQINGAFYKIFLLVLLKREHLSELTGLLFETANYFA